VSDEDLALVVTENLGVIIDTQGHPVGNPVLFSTTPGSLTLLAPSSSPSLLPLLTPPVLLPSSASWHACGVHRTSGALLQTLTVTAPVTGAVTGAVSGAVTRGVSGAVTGAVTGGVMGGVAGRRGQLHNVEVGPSPSPSPSGPESLTGKPHPSQQQRQHSSAGDLTKAGGQGFAKSGSAIFGGFTGNNTPSGASTPTGMLTPTGYGAPALEGY